MNRDGGVEQSPKIEISRTDTVLPATFTIMFKGVPSVGQGNFFLMLGEVTDPPAMWRVLATGPNKSVLAPRSLNLTSVRQFAADGAQAFELHGTFVATMPEVTGVQGPDLIVNGSF
jgi:hypothetical protein